VPDLDFLATDTLSWTAPPHQGAVTVVYDVLRSAIAADFTSATTCVESDDGSDTQAMDTASPTAGTVFLYLSRAQNGCPVGEGSLGQTSAGASRFGRGCP